MSTLKGVKEAVDRRWNFDAEGGTRERGRVLSKKGIGLENEEREGLGTIRRGRSILKRVWSTLQLVLRVFEDWGENEMLLDECWLTMGRVFENSGGV